MFGESEIQKFLQEHEILFERHEHPPVFTCEDAALHLKGLSGRGSKNLFLRNKKGDKHALVSVSEEKRVDLKTLGDHLGLGRPSFGSAERLREHLGVEPGSVSVLGLINDTSNAVELYIDRDLWSSEAIHYHPLVNTATLLIAPTGVAEFVRVIGREVSVIDIPVVVGR
jgi:Ala-tRNA(Pro) deacylase